MADKKKIISINESDHAEITRLKEEHGCSIAELVSRLVREAGQAASAQVPTTSAPQDAITPPRLDATALPSHSDDPFTVYCLEAFDGSLWAHRDQGPIVFLDKEDAITATEDKDGNPFKMSSIKRCVITMASAAQLSEYAFNPCDHFKLPPGATYITLLRREFAA